MKKTGNDRTLESFKIYPYVTWGLIIGFAFFVYNITQKLEAVTDELGAYSDYMETQSSIAPEQIENFERPVKKS
jgi:hypothetical protein